MFLSFIKAYGMCKTLHNLSYLFCFWNNHSAIVSDQLDFQTCCSAVFELVWFSAFHRALKRKNLIKIEDRASVRIVIVPNISRIAAVVFCPVRPELFPRNHLARSFRVFWGHSQVINPKSSSVCSWMEQNHSLSRVKRIQIRRMMPCGQMTSCPSGPRRCI